MSFGVFYLATGAAHQLMLEQSKASLRVVQPAVDLCSITSESFGGYASRQLKTQIHRLTPFENTLYLDCDTLIQSELREDEIFKGDIALAIDRQKKLGVTRGFNWSPTHVTMEEVDETIALCGPDADYFNGGVMAWRRSAASSAFFELWHEEWSRWKRCDQFALCRAIKRSGVEVSILPPRYNCMIGADVDTGPILGNPDIAVVHFIGARHKERRYGVKL